MSIYTVNGRPVKYDNKWLATNGGTPSSELPPYDSSDAGKALVVNSEGDDVEWQDVGSTITVDQTYDSTSTNPQSGTAVAEALQTVPDELPSITGNSNKVLKVNADATGVEWAAESAGATYTAGNGLTLNGTEFSVDTSVVATKNDLASKQDTLTAGANITIENNIISATGGGGGSGVSTYKFVIEQAHTYNLLTYGDFVFTVSLNGNNQQHLCISSSTVSGACISSQHTLYSPYSYGLSGSVLGCTNHVPYTPTSLSSEVQLFRINDVNGPPYPSVYDFTLFYEKNGSPYVFNIKTFTIYTEIIDPDQGTIRTRTMYISVG